MAIVVTDDKHYKDIADAIRGCFAKDNTSGYDPTKQFTPSEMPQAAVDAYQCGYDNGHYEGYPEGYGTGYDEGHAAGVMDGYEQGVEAGKPQGVEAFLRNSRHLSAEASGAVAVCEYASPAFEMTVNVSGDGVSDLSAVTVSRYGKNLFKLQDFAFTTSSSECEVKDGVFTARYTTQVSTATPLGSSRLVPNYVGVPVFPSGTYTFWAEFCNNSAYGGGSYPYLEIKLEDDTIERLEVNQPKTIAQRFTANALKFVTAVSKAAGDVYTTPLQLVCGGETAYEPFVEPTTYTADANGTVQGVKGISPNMTLVTDTDGVTINCSYLRDIDTYIDSLTMGVSMAAVDGTSGNEVM